MEATAIQIRLERSNHARRTSYLAWAMACLAGLSLTATSAYAGEPKPALVSKVLAQPPAASDLRLTLPDASPAPSSAATRDADAPNPAATTPQAAAEVFFAHLASDRVDEAFTALTRGSKLAKRERDLTLFRERTRQVISDYGKIGGSELLEEKPAGSNLIRLTYVSRAESYPLRWRLYFYKAQDSWEVIDMRVDDNMRALFQEDQPASGQSLAAKRAED